MIVVLGTLTINFDMSVPTPFNSSFGNVVGFFETLATPIGIGMFVRPITLLKLVGPFHFASTLCVELRE